MRYKPQRRKNKRNSQGRGNINQLTENQIAEGDDAGSDFFYYYFFVFSSGATDEEIALELIVEDKLINTAIDSGDSCNLMSEEVFDFVTGGRVNLLECTKKVSTRTPDPQFFKC